MLDKLIAQASQQDPQFFEALRAKNAAEGRTPGVRRMKKGGCAKKMAKGGSVSSASKRADGCATKGKTKGKMI